MTIASPTALLVAVDFSSCSLRALETALSWRSPGAEVTLLHVLDSELARHLESTGLGSYAETIGKLRTRAEKELEALQGQYPEGSFDPMIVEGIAFVEIVKIANDLDCDLVVMGTHGQQPGVVELLFGGTAEKVLRAARRPVLCVP